MEVMHFSVVASPYKFPLIIHCLLLATLSSTNLIKTHKIQLATNIYPLRADAEDANFFQPSLCINDASSHGSRECWRHRDGDNVKRFNDDGMSWNLQQRSKLMNKNSVNISSKCPLILRKAKFVLCFPQNNRIWSAQKPGIISTHHKLNSHDNPVLIYPQATTSSFHFPLLNFKALME